MALTKDAEAAGWQKFTFTAADTTPDITNMQQIQVDDGQDAVNGNSVNGHQAVRFMAQFSDSGATGALVLCLVDVNGDGIIGYWTLTPTITGVRSSQTGAASGNYMATVAMGLNTSTDTFDLNGIGRQGGALRLYLGCTALSAGSLIVYACPTRCI